MKKSKTQKEILDAMVTEDEVQEAAVTYLRLKGLTVLQTNLAKKRALCDKGVPDLIVTSNIWPTGCWCGIEIKKPVGGKLSAEQEKLFVDRRIFVARSPQEAWEAVEFFLWARTMVYADRLQWPRISEARFAEVLVRVRAFVAQTHPADLEGNLRGWLKAELRDIGVHVGDK